jgi:hypothetical protein
MLAKDPALRFPTPGQAAQVLRWFLPSQGIAWGAAR